MALYPMLMLLRRTCDDSWIEPCSEGQPLASKGRREAGGVVHAGLDDASRARLNVANPTGSLNPRSARSRSTY